MRQGARPAGAYNTQIHDFLEDPVNGSLDPADPGQSQNCGNPQPLTEALVLKNASRLLAWLA
jgi:hypothetical protein